MTTRKRLNCQVASAALSARDQKELNPSLRNLAIPWAMLALLAVCAAIGTTISSSSNLFSTLVPSFPATTISDSTDSISIDHQKLPSWITHRLMQEVEPTTEEKYTFDHQVPPLFPLSPRDYATFICATLGLMIAAGGGIGGGGILVPIYILVLGFSPKHAIPLSNVTVFGGAIANTLLNAKKRHPLADRPLVDWDLILVMEPLTIGGALLGAFLNKILPEELLTVLLVLLLSFTAYNTLKKSIKMYKKETAQLLQQRADGSKESELTRIANEDEADDDEESEDSLLDNMELQDGEDVTDENIDLPEVDLKTQELHAILEEEKETPMGNVTMLIVLFIVVLFINLMKGGGAFESPLGIKCGSTSFWISNVVMLLWIFVISVIARSYLVRRYEAKKRCGYEYVEGDIQWDPRATIVYPIVCCLAGFFAGMFGVGGGIVKGPLMLAMGVHPAVSSASSACMILFTSFTATTSFLVFGLLVPDYGVVCIIIGFLATFVGQLVLNHLMKKYQRNSYIAFSIGGVVLLSALLMTIQSLVSLAERNGHHSSGGICGTET